MTLKEFAASVPGFSALSHQNRIALFGWWLHTHVGRPYFGPEAMRKCHETLHLGLPNLSQEFARLCEKKRLIKDVNGYRVEHKEMGKLDAKFGQHETTVAVSALLKDLATKVSDEAEKRFLSEAIKCYNVRAARAAIVMVWNLAYDHLLRWVLAKPARVDAFNSKIIARIGVRKGTGLLMAKREDFEELREQEVLDIIGNANILRSGNTKKILDTYLTRRNLAAHPSLVEIDLPAAEDMITSLAKNIILAEL